MSLISGPISPWIQLPMSHRDFKKDPAGRIGGQVYSCTYYM